MIMQDERRIRLAAPETAPNACSMTSGNGAARLNNKGGDGQCRLCASGLPFPFQWSMLAAAGCDILN
jgi:hypothetical protein